MGEMADWTLSQIEDDLYFANVMYLEEHDSFIGPGVRKHPICRFCGKKNLRWQRLGERWLLYEKKGPHKCPKHPLPLDVLKKLAEENIATQRRKKK